MGCGSQAANQGLPLATTITAYLKDNPDTKVVCLRIGFFVFSQRKKKNGS